MKEILILIIVYIGYLFVWFAVNLLAYFASLAFRKKTIIGGLAGISVLASYLLSFIIGIIVLIWMISVLLEGQILLFLLLLLFGGGLIISLIMFLQTPFVAIPMYLAEKTEKIDFEESVVEAEILDKDDRVIGKTEGETAISVRLAKWFLAIYGLGIINIIIFPVEREGLMRGDYLTKPFLQIISTTVIVGLPYGIYRKLKYKAFFPEDKRYFLIQVWKLSIYIFGSLAALVFILALITGTL